MVRSRVSFVEKGARPSYGSWREFFKVDVLRGASYVSRIIRLIEVLRNSSRTPSTVKIVMGVIGRDTVGHSRDVQNCFSEFLGVDCIGCHKAVERISSGIPFSQVWGSVGLRFRESELLSKLKVLERLLRESLRNSIGLDIDDDYIASLIEKDYTSLAGNPLRVFNMVRGLLVTLSRLLPLRNPHTFFLQLLRWVPRFAFDTLVDKRSLDLVEQFGVATVELIPAAKAEYSLLAHKPGSVGDLIMSAIDVVYGVYEVVLPHSSRYLRVRDERRNYVTSAVPALISLAGVLGVKRELHLIENSLLSKAVKAGGDSYRLVRHTLSFDNPAHSVSFKGTRISIEVFMKGIAPYLVLGLARFDDILIDEKTVTATLSTYLRVG